MNVGISDPNNSSIFFATTPKSSVNFNLVELLQNFHKPKVFKIGKKSGTFPSERSVTRLLRCIMSLNDFVYINKTSQNRLNRKIIILSSG